LNPVETPDPPHGAKQDEPAGAAAEARTSALVPVPARPQALPDLPKLPGLPSPPDLPSPPRRKPRWRMLLALALVCAGIGAGGFNWWRQHQARLPDGIVSGNGRIEAQEIDVDTKFAGRVAELLVDEGDLVSAGQVVARMDVRDLEATLRKTEAQVQQAQRSLEEAKANVVQQQSQVTLAKQEIARTTTLVARGYATNELLDQRRQSLNGATALLNAANARVGEAERALDAASHDVELYKVNIADNTLVAPTLGRIQYRIANVGEVLPAGGKVFTLLDISDVYMDVYLPTADAGRAKIGSDAKIVLDAYPKFAVPAHVSFIATQAQFTPKAVETKTERDKLMFRVKVRVDPEILRAHAADVRTGLPGLAYVRVDPKAAWPAWLPGPTPP
jgi:HlyD family secretion protein